MSVGDPMSCRLTALRSKDALAMGVVAVVSRLVADEDGDGHPDAPWPRWSSRGRH
jgi:hypothetical protein